MKNKKALSILIVATFALIVLVYFGYTLKENIEQFQRTPELLRGFADAHPYTTPIVIIAVIILEVIIAPLPGGFLPVATGVLFGTFYGTIYSWTGNFFGAMLSYLIARKFGRRVVKKLVKEKKLHFYDQFIERHSVIIWLIYIVPIFPIDIVSFSLGLSKIPFRKFALIVGLALIPNMWLLNMLGNGIYQSNISRILWAVGIVTIVILTTSFIKEMKKSKYNV